MSVDPGVRSYFNRLVWVTRLTGSRLLVGEHVDQRGFRGAVNIAFGDADDAVWHCLFTDQGFRFYKGPHPEPLGTVRLSDELFLQMLAGHTSYYTAEMTGRVRVEGDGHSAWIVSTTVRQSQAQARRRGFAGWISRWFIRSALRKSPARYDLRL